MALRDERIPAIAPQIEVSFNGERLAAYQGESIAACLVAAGKLTLRRERADAPRGLFCGMGVCQECVVTVDGRPNQRACMTPVTDGMRIEIQQPSARQATTVTAPSTEPTSAALERPGILVVGGGPAGLSAARSGARAGARVTLIDERASLGGQFYKQLAETHRHAAAEHMDRQYREGAALIAPVERSSAQIRCGTTVWGAFGPGELVARAGRQTIIYRPKTLILATGAHDRGLPVPGWILPGFMTTGAA